MHSCCICLNQFDSARPADVFSVASLPGMHWQCPRIGTPQVQCTPRLLLDSVSMAASAPREGKPAHLLPQAKAHRQLKHHHQTAQAPSGSRCLSGWHRHMRNSSAGMAQCRARADGTLLRTHALRTLTGTPCVDACTHRSIGIVKSRRHYSRCSMAGL